VKKVLFDIETDGLLDVVTTVWCLVLKDMETGEVRRYRDVEHTQRPYPEASRLAEPPITGSIVEGVRLLDEAEVLVGHNIIDYDVPAIRKLFPWAKLTPSRFIDTLTLARLCYPDIKPTDFGCYEKWQMPKQLIGRQSLESWGYRLGLHKIDYKDWCKQYGIGDPWAQYTPEMMAYCEGDIELNYRLFVSLSRKEPPRRAVDLEMAYAVIAKEMEHNGFPLDIDKAHKLYADLTQRKAELVQEVAGLFDDWWEPIGEVTVSKTRKENTGEGFWRLREKGKTRKPDLLLLEGGYAPGWNVEEAHEWHAQGKAIEFVPALRWLEEGAVYTQIERRSFNPQSRQHIADRLQKVYGWVPKKFGKNGTPTLDDELLADLPFPPCKLLAEYFLIQKRLGQVAEGNQAWLKLEKFSEVHGRKAHRIHGQMNTIGTVTFRCSHSKPNMAQVPSIENAEGLVPYGKECRDIFTAEKGWVLVGCDAQGLQLRGLAHNLSPFDDGAYTAVVTSGDPHEANRQAAGIDTRARAKRFIYCFLFGGGGWKIGFTVGGATPEEVAAVLAANGKGQSHAIRHLDFIGLPHTPTNIATTLKGFKLKNTFLKKTLGLRELIGELQAEAEANKCLVGLDGRKVPVRSSHAALNTKLMSDEAILTKEWKLIAYQELERSGLRNGADFLYHVDVHDEIQVGFRPELAQQGAALLERMVVQAGINLGYRCPLLGKANVGDSWAGTH
jgi:DNA polymerase-1